VGIVYVEGIDERKDTVGVDMRLFDMFDEMESRCTLCIARAKEGMGEEAIEIACSHAVFVVWAWSVAVAKVIAAMVVWLHVSLRARRRWLGGGSA
jgi:hypothetical protein